MGQTPLLFRKLQVGAVLAAVTAVGLFLYGRSIDGSIDRHHGWIGALRTAQIMVPSQGPYPDHGALEGVLHSLEVALPEIEAAEATRLQTVRNCTEATLKVVNTSMSGSPRRHLREEALAELHQSLLSLIPEVQQHTLDLAGKRLLVNWIMLGFGLITVGLAVACLVVGKRARKV